MMQFLLTYGLLVGPAAGRLLACLQSTRPCLRSPREATAAEDILGQVDFHAVVSPERVGPEA
ncbi:exported hypothetical protein [Bradyrhizobium sp. STM 3843]|nr:exported hypothetical protein [Bradyrhizobium sp. STM 3843]